VVVFREDQRGDLRSYLLLVLAVFGMEKASKSTSTSKR